MSTLRGALWSVLFTKYYSGDHIKSTRWVGHVASRVKEEVHTGYLGGDLREETT